MKAMILAAGKGTRLQPLTLTLPKPMLPVGNKAALEHIVELCKRHNVNDIKMNLHYLPEYIDKCFKDGSQWGVNISYSIEKQLWGTAGGIKKVQSFFNETFVVLSGDGFTDIDLTDMLRFHKEKGALATIAVKKADDPSKFGVVISDKDSRITSFQEKPAKEDALSDKINLGIYILEPEVLNMIPPRKEFDFGYDLFPYFLKNNIPFYSYETNCSWSDIGSLEEYWKINMDLVSGKLGNKFEGVLIHPSAKIERSSLRNIQGPVIIGKNSEICSDVKLQGPLVIGDEVYIDTGATISNSVILSNTYIGKGVELNDSVVNQNYHLSVKNNFGMYVDDDKVLRSHRIIPFHKRLDLFFINLTDKVISFIALLLLSPLFLLISILIKLDSKGPVFYISKRLRAPEIERKGNHLYVFYKEKSVKYYVFRTMYSDADKRVKELSNKYESGPFHKIENDPRVTRLGRFLRKTSIDELPLFWNVLKGDMSLVGIWALPAYEADELLKQGLKSGSGSDIFDLSDMAQVRFQGKLGLAGFWQARGRSNLTAEERAIHDTVQSIMGNISHDEKDYLGEYAEFKSYKGYLKMLLETFLSVVKRDGAM